MVKWLNNNITYQIKNVQAIAQYVIMIYQRLWRTVQDDFLSEAIQKYLIYLQFLQLGLYYRYIRGEIDCQIIQRYSAQ